MATEEQLSFGPYLLDTKARRLTHDGAEVPMASRHFDLLWQLASHAGRVLSIDFLIDAAWRGVAATTDTLDQAIDQLRQAVPLPFGQPLIEMQAPRGYRFVAEVSRVDRDESHDGIDAVLSAHRAWIEGRAALETLEGGAIVDARRVFDDVAKRAPGLAAAHVGLANACALQFEMTRTDAMPDVGTLEEALAHAREACRLEPSYSEAWATLGFVLDRIGRHDDAVATERQALILEPDNWRHHLRLSVASWGEERLQEARHALRLRPGLAMAHWLAATVLVARQLPAEADIELQAALSSHDAEESTRLSGIAVHWLRGLIALSAGETTRALIEFEHELVLEDSGHLYARESAANTWYAIGATRLRLCDFEGAHEAFREALRRVPAHPRARAALGMDAASAGRSPLETALANAIACAGRGDTPNVDAEAASIERALEESPSGDAGWMLPVEPLLNIAPRADSWRDVLASLRRRAN